MYFDFSTQRNGILAFLKEWIMVPVRSLALLFRRWASDQHHLELIGNADSQAPDEVCSVRHCA